MSLTSKEILDFHNSGLCPYLLGKHGEGKTQFVKDLSKELKKKLVILNLSSIESVDFSGMPYIENGITKYATPYFFGAGILFLDEVEKVSDTSVKACLHSLIVDRKIHEHTLNDDCIIIAAGNNALEDCEVEASLMDRFLTVPFRYSIEEKIAYLKKKYKDNQFVAFLEAKTELFNDFSGRRIEAFLKANNNGLLKYFFDVETERLFNHFMHESLVSLQDIKADKYDFKKLSPITISSLINQIVDNFYTIEKNEGICRNINKFINKLSQEQKSVYFTKLKKVCLDDGEKFKAAALELNKSKLFDKQKEFLSELVL